MLMCENFLNIYGEDSLIDGYIEMMTKEFKIRNTILRN